MARQIYRAVCGRVRNLPTCLFVFLLFCLLTFLPFPALAADSLNVEQAKREGWLSRLVRSFSDQDTGYVEPQHYNWSLMLQGTYNYDYYRLRTAEGGQSVALAPAPTIKVGPYFGWRWIFLGYTFDLKNLQFGGSSQKQEFDLSVYSARFGFDVFSRRTGSDYKIRQLMLDEDTEARLLAGSDFDGVKVSSSGGNLYYIFNYRHFSYPAAFAQSTCQKISCGSWMVGIGFTSNVLEFDHAKLEKLVKSRYPASVAKLDSGLMFNRVKYSDINASVGYGYNWVFARHWLFSSSLSMAVAYKAARGETADKDKQGFDFGNFNIDGIGRFGIIWNNVRWYAGANAIVRTNNYHTSRFTASNVFGYFNLYVGYNFGLRSQYKKQRQ